jgi:hypothetical protein
MARPRRIVGREEPTAPVRCPRVMSEATLKGQVIYVGESTNSEGI